MAREIRNKMLREQRNNIIITEPNELMSTYNVILADPPWQYDFTASENRSQENHYPVMTTEELYNLYIPAEDNSVLFLWSPAAHLQNALMLMDEWGFIYKTSAVWDKEIIGMGYYFRNRHEMILIGIKGIFKPPLPEDRPSSVYQERRTQYSKKPNYYYDMIEKMYPNCKYLELFARQQYNDKWTAWGNQIEKRKNLQEQLTL